MFSRNTMNIFLALIVGALAGAGLAIIYAPASGKETRKKIFDLEEELVGDAEDLVSKTKDKVLKEAGRIQTRLAGVKTFTKGR